MKPQDYYHRVALAAKEIADEYESAVRDSLGKTGERDRLKEEVKDSAETLGRHRLFTDELGGMWTVSTFDADQAALMGEIIEVSNRSFRDKVEGRPSEVLREGAATTMTGDIQSGVFMMLRHRLADE